MTQYRQRFQKRTTITSGLLLVHYGAGFWGVIAVTLFSKKDGVFYDWDELAFKRLGWNLLGAIAISAWSLFWGLAVFMTLKLLKILRVSRDIEIKGKLY
jgi:ammonia channel protein AmtB